MGEEEHVIGKQQVINQPCSNLPRNLNPSALNANPSLLTSNANGLAITVNAVQPSQPVSGNVSGNITVTSFAPLSISNETFH
jgi:hypothetical protein